MFKTILLCTDGSPGAGAAIDGALWLAHKLHAHLRALYVTDIRILEGPLLADLSGAIGAQPYPAMLPQLRALQKQKADAILSASAQRCRERHVACDTIQETGSLVHTMLEHERDVDLVVLGQRGEHAQWHGQMLGSSVERMVRASVKPCLVVPAPFNELRHILIAHDGSAESTNALHLGLDLAGALRTDLTLVTACQREHEEAASKVLQAAHALATERKLPARAQLVHGNPETAILHLCDELPAALIVIGAYGHTRIREWILGSTTSHVIRKTHAPVLLTRGAARA